MAKSAKKRKARAQARAKARARRNVFLVIGSVIVVAVILLVIFLPAGGGEQITVAEAAVKHDQGAFILDVRAPEEWEEYHIPGSTLIPLEELEARVSEVPRDQEVVIVCRTGNRSRQGRDILKRAGFTEVSSMAGGMRQWAAQGYPTETGP